MWVTPPFGHMALLIWENKDYLQVGIITDTKIKYHKSPAYARLFLRFLIIWEFYHKTILIERAVIELGMWTSFLIFSEVFT
jgi:hypothetical protein